MSKRLQLLLLKNNLIMMLNMVQVPMKEVKTRMSKLSKKTRKICNMSQKLLFLPMNIKRQRMNLPKMIKKRVMISKWRTNLPRLIKRNKLKPLLRKLWKKIKWLKTAYQHQIHKICQEKTKMIPNLKKVWSSRRCSSLREPSLINKVNGRLLTPRETQFLSRNQFILIVRMMLQIAIENSEINLSFNSSKIDCSHWSFYLIIKF